MSAAGGGYSGTPLAKKLGLRIGTVLFLDAEPDNYWQLIEPVPVGLRLSSTMSDAVDIAHLFSTSKKSLESIIRRALQRLRPNAVIWVSWPKKASKVETDITEDVIRSVALPLGLVDIKVCAVDEVWSGLKLVLRRELRKPPVS